MGFEDPIEKKENVPWKSDNPLRFIKNNFELGLIKKGQIVVDIGCGFGRNSNYLESQGVNAIGININSEELETAKEKAQEKELNTKFIKGNATELPLEDSSCDVVLDTGCSHMLNSADQIKAEKEQARVIKPGGYLFYFGFSKKHPAYVNNPNSPMFRNLEDIEKIYGEDFEVISSEDIEWKPVVEENASVDLHKGIDVIMRRKSSVAN